MGIYDREYYRDEPGGFRIRKPGTIVGWIIIVNIVVFLAGALFSNKTPVVHNGVPDIVTTQPLNDMLGLKAGDLVKPWLWWHFLTYGFCHASIGHIFGNMLGLFFLGPPIEQRYGQREFLRLYLTLIVFAGVAWAAVQWFSGANPLSGVVGASGAVVGVIVLFALNYPKQTLYLNFILPVPAWVVGVIVVIGDLYGAAYHPGQIAYQAHLAGAGLAFLYWRGGWNFTRLTDKVSPEKLFQRRPKLKVHHPDDDIPDMKEAARAAEMDRILEKVHREGEESLTRKERRTLQNESRRLREKRGNS
jgi:membrane associated rhomboid family serine protease